MSNLRFAVWDGIAHVARSEAHDWTHSLCNAHGGPTGETRFVEGEGLTGAPCEKCLLSLDDEVQAHQKLFSQGLSARAKARARQDRERYSS